MIHTDTVKISFDSTGHYAVHPCIQELCADDEQTYMVVISDHLTLLRIPPYESTGLYNCPQNWIAAT